MQTMYAIIHTTWSFVIIAYNQWIMWCRLPVNSKLADGYWWYLLCRKTIDRDEVIKFRPPVVPAQSALSVCQRGRCSRFSPVCRARRPRRPKSGDKVRRQHSPSQVLWCGTTCQRQSEIPVCQTSNLLWSLTCLLDYILETASTVTICDGALESVLRVMAP